jgi:ubiquinone/menaquinone biosynthesis C-methylase UbiE
VKDAYLCDCYKNKIINKMIFTTLIYKALYWYISTVDKKNEVIFMNYGYHDATESIELHEIDEVNRYSIQLYHRLAKMVDVNEKNIVEIGCGRGGGIAYISKMFTPASAIGVDLNSKAVKFGNTHYELKNLKFEQGNAQSLHFDDESKDIVFNVESSHRYAKMDDFLSEVYRILKPGGYFLFTDFRYKDEMTDLVHLLAQYDFIKFDEQFINNEVNTALDLDAKRREALVEKYAPPFLQKALHNFAGNNGSTTYKQIKDGGIIYFVFCFQKPLK